MAPEFVAIGLLAGHALADYPLQGDFIAKAKNRANPIPGFPWWQALWPHAAMHGAIVAFVTGIWWLFIAETVIHFITDDAKCMGRLTLNQDQAIHIGCKVVWFAIWLALP